MKIKFPSILNILSELAPIQNLKISLENLSADFNFIEQGFRLIKSEIDLHKQQKAKLNKMDNFVEDATIFYEKNNQGIVSLKNELNSTKENVKYL